MAGVVAGLSQLYTAKTVMQALLDSLITRVQADYSTQIPNLVAASAHSAINTAITKSATKALTSKSNDKYYPQPFNESNVNPTDLAVSSDADVPMVQIEFANSVLKLVEQKLQSVQILLLADLNVALSHLSDARHALALGKTDKFQYFIHQSYLKSREAQYKVPDSVSKIYVYSLILFNGFLLFSDFGVDYEGGLSFIQKSLAEINCDIALNQKLKEALSSYFYWNKPQKILIAHCVAFSSKISTLIRAIATKIEQNQSAERKLQKITQRKLAEMKRKQIRSYSANHATNLWLSRSNIPIASIIPSKQQNIEPPTLRTLNPVPSDRSTTATREVKESRSIFAQWQNVDFNANEQKSAVNEVCKSRAATVDIDVDSWAPNIWNGNFFGTIAHIDATDFGKISDPSYYLALFQLKAVDNTDEMWYCNTNRRILIFDDNRWTQLGNSLLYDYYYRNVISRFNFDKFGKLLCRKHWEMHFKKTLNLNQNKLTFTEKWENLHPKLKKMLKYYLIIPLKSCQKKEELGFLNIVNSLTISSDKEKFSLKGAKFIADIISFPTNRISSLHLVDCGLDDKCVQLLSNALLCLPPLTTSILTEISFYGNKQITDESLKFFLTKVVPLKCTHLLKLALMWTGISTEFCNTIVGFFRDNPKHPLHWIYLSHNAIHTKGALLLNALLASQVCRDRNEVIIYVTDCSIDQNSCKLWDPRLVLE